LFKIKEKEWEVDKDECLLGGGKLRDNG